MSRYTKTAKLVNVTVSFDKNGSAIEGKEYKEVFVNPYTLGASTWVAARAAGLKADSQIELRSCEYDNQQTIIFEDIEYEIERVSDKGEFTTLTLKRRANND